MPILLSDAVAELPDWTLRPFKAKAGQMQVAGILCKNGHWPVVQLLSTDYMGAVTVPFRRPCTAALGTSLDRELCLRFRTASS
jgi:hypothetical protein